MRFHAKRTPDQGVTFEITSGGRLDGGYQWGLPARVYRRVARDTINGLLEENRKLRHHLNPNQPLLLRFRLGALIVNIFAKEK